MASRVRVSWVDSFGSKYSAGFDEYWTPDFVLALIADGAESLTLSVAS